MLHDYENSASASSLSDALFSRIREDILSGKLKDGEKLTEKEIGEAYNVSRTPVREAFKQLELDGLISNMPNRGAYVCGFSHQDIADIYELRKSGEILAVQWGISRISEKELESLKEAYELMEFYTLKLDYPKMLSMNARFHELICKASHSRILEQSLSLYQLYTKQTRAPETYVAENLELVLVEHRQILDAYMDKTPDAGIAAMSTHLDNAKKRASLK